MSIDIKAVQSKFINIAKDRIGQYLTQISTSGGDIPAVIPARSNKTKPPYPYCTVDIINLSQPFVHTLYKGIDEVTEEETIQKQKRLMVLYRIYAGTTSSDNAAKAQWLASTLLDSFSFSRTIDELDVDLGLSVQEETDIDDLPIKLSTTYLETAAFNLIVTYTDVITDTDPFIIETTNLSGEVYPKQGDYNDFYEVDLTVTQP